MLDKKGTEKHVFLINIKHFFLICQSTIFEHYVIQKKPTKGVLRKGCSGNFEKSQEHTRGGVLFSKVAGLQVLNSNKQLRLTIRKIKLTLKHFLQAKQICFGMVFTKTF